jgi:hypothetical protein
MKPGFPPEGSEALSGETGARFWPGTRKFAGRVWVAETDILVRSTSPPRFNLLRKQPFLGSYWRRSVLFLGQEPSRARCQ